MDIYTPIEEAGELIRKRWADINLRKKVEEQLGSDIPEILKKGPHGMIWRQIGTPDREFERFLELNKTANLKPLCFEYIQDKFSARNFTKYGLTNLPIKTGVDKNLKTIITRKKIIDFKDAEKKRMFELTTLWGENLVVFHNNFLKKIFPVMEDSIFDISEWVKNKGGMPKNYYSAILSLAICHLVFFDDFDLLDTETNFINEIVLPAIKDVENIFGIKPIIVKISKPGEHQQDPFWWCYSEKANDILENHIKTFKC